MKNGFMGRLVYEHIVKQNLFGAIKHIDWQDN